MKRLYILYLLICIFAYNIPTKTMDYAIDYTPQRESALSLKNLCVNAITTKLEKLLKQTAYEGRSTCDFDFDKIRSYIEDINSENVPLDIKEMIRMAILTKSVRKAFTTYYTNGQSFDRMLITQHFDGSKTSLSEHMNTPFEYRLKSSPWYDLPFEDIIHCYSATYYAKKYARAHPFISTPFASEAGPTPLSVTPGPGLTEYPDHLLL